MAPLIVETFYHRYKFKPLSNPADLISSSNSPQDDALPTDSLQSPDFDQIYWDYENEMQHRTHNRFTLPARPPSRPLIYEYKHAPLTASRTFQYSKQNPPAALTSGEPALDQTISPIAPKITMNYLSDTDPNIKIARQHLIPMVRLVPFHYLYLPIVFGLYSPMRGNLTEHSYNFLQLSDILRTLKLFEHGPIFFPVHIILLTNYNFPLKPDPIHDGNYNLPAVPITTTYAYNPQHFPSSNNPMSYDLAHSSISVPIPAPDLIRSKAEIDIIFDEIAEIQQRPLASIKKYFHIHQIPFQQLGELFDQIEQDAISKRIAFFTSSLDSQ